MNHLSQLLFQLFFEYMDTTIGVIGLGYVGLPLALAFARKFPAVYGFDIDKRKVGLIQNGIDPTEEGFDDQLKETRLRATSSISDLAECTFFIVGVPTPIDENRTPDLRILKEACKAVSSILKRGDLVVFESTVYPGITEEFCGPILEQGSNLVCGKDFFIGYSPERINPGDKEHTLERITKVVSGQNEEILERVSLVYGKVIEAGVYKAPSIQVAEAAKVIENTQRDLNIALMNELAIIFDKMGISTKEVLATAGTKWNFLRFTPGLVGGHCIGVDPYYLTTKAQQLGYNPQVILAGRRINDAMGVFIAQKTIKLLIQCSIQPKGAVIGILGVTFKENVADLRNSRVPEIYRELAEFGASVSVYDPYGKSEEAMFEYKITLSDLASFKDLDALIIAVPHREIISLVNSNLDSMVKRGGVVVDIKSVLEKRNIPSSIIYWSL